MLFYAAFLNKNKLKTNLFRTGWTGRDVEARGNPISGILTTSMMTGRSALWTLFQMPIPPTLTVSQAGPFKRENKHAGWLVPGGLLRKSTRAKRGRCDWTKCLLFHPSEIEITMLGGTTIGKKLIDLFVSDFSLYL